MAFLIALVAGALSVLAYAPFEQFWLQPLCWGLLYALLIRVTRARRGAALAATWALGAFFAGLCWLVVALNLYGGMVFPVAVGFIVLMSAVLALYPALSGALFVRFMPRQGLMRAPVAAAFWTLGELLRGQLFPAFPWLAIGYTQTPPSPLAGWAAVSGVYGVGFLLALSSAWLAEAWLTPPLRRRALVAACLPWLAGAGLRLVSWTHAEGEAVGVALIQTNVAQDEKWDAARIGEWLELNLSLLAANRAPLMVLPETTLPVLAEQLPAGYLDTLAAQARAAGGNALLGTFTSDGEGRIYNSVLALGADGAQRYSKNHLVPFGEYAPAGFAWFFRLASIPMADQTPGGAAQPLLRLAGQRVAMNICYEDVFGEELIRALPEATMMINVSNLAWYGNSHAQPQHLQISRMRALETGRPQLRATNTGMTAVVRPDGSVQAVLPPFTRGVLRAEVQGYAGATPFVRLADWPLKLLVAGLVVWAVRQRRARGGMRINLR